jgi:hypothetical protein
LKRWPKIWLAAITPPVIAAASSAWIKKGRYADEVMSFAKR